MASQFSSQTSKSFSTGSAFFGSDMPKAAASASVLSSIFLPPLTQ